MGEIVTDLNDFIGRGSLELQEPGSEYQRVRIKLKEGLESITIPSGLGIIYLAAGGQTVEWPEGSYSSGEKATLFFRTGPIKIDYDDEKQALSELLGQVDELLDPLPSNLSVSTFFYDEELALITNQDFTAPQGLFSNADQDPSVFYRSLMKVIPKIYSDSALAQMVIFPPSYDPYDAEKPESIFKDCPNIESAADQGEFGEFLQVLNRVNLTYRKNGEEFDRLAYPTGGSPKIVNGYVYGERILFSEKFPTIGTTELVQCSNFIDCEEMVITSSAPTLPLGPTFRDATKLKSLTMPRMKWSVDLGETVVPERYNFSFSWGTLGVEAPPNAIFISGLYSIWQSFGAENKDSYILTPARLKDGVNAGWGSALENLVNNGLEVSDDFMPLPVSGVKTMVGYYNKVLIGDERAIEGKPSMISLRQRPFLDDENRYYIVPPLTLSGPKPALTDYCSNLYSDLVIEFDITIPALPSGLSYCSNAYRRTFYNAVGKEKPIDLEVKPVLTVFYSIGANGRPDTYVVPNMTSDYEGEFRDAFENLYGNNDPVGSPQGVMVSELLASPTINPAYSPQYWSVRSDSHFTYLNDFIDYALSKVDQVWLTTSRIESSIVLERGTSIAPEQLYGFQTECFYGAAIDPRVVDALIPMPTASIADDDSYSGVLNIFVGIGSVPLRYAWTPRTTTPMAGSGVSTFRASEWWDDDKLFSFLAVITWTGGESEEREDYRYKLDDIIWSGSPRVQDSWNTIYDEWPRVRNPYYAVLSNRSIKGNQSDFMAAKGIDLYDDEDFNAYTESIDTDGSFKGPNIGWNIYCHDDYERPTITQNIDRFLVSYDRNIYEQFGISVTKHKFFDFYKPHPEDEWDGPAGWIAGSGASRFLNVDFPLDPGSQFTAAGFINGGIW